MKLEEINGKREYRLKFSAHSITVKTSWENGGKTKGIIRDVTNVMDMPFIAQVDLNKLLKTLLVNHGISSRNNGIAKSAFYISGKQYYYLHNMNTFDFYENQINNLGSPICPDEYARHIEHEKIVDDLRKTGLVTVIDYWPY